jgi:hypothetical protein
LKVIHFKPVLTFTADTWILTKRNKSKIQAMDLKFLRSFEGRNKKK